MPLITARRWLAEMKVDCNTGPVGLAAVTTVAACAQAPGADGATVSLFKSLGGRQCESPGPSPQALVAPLRDAKIELKSMRCGSDGRMRA